MPLNERPLTVNAYAYSKIWYCCRTVDFRICDFSSITSSVKKFIYADLLIKPEEDVLHRKISQGGLGLTSVRLKGQACLLRNFLELAADPRYQSSLYLSVLFRVHVAGEDVPCPALPPYSNKNFFGVIRRVIEDGECVTTMSTKQWYNYLLKKNMSVVEEDKEDSQLNC